MGCKWTEIPRGAICVIGQLLQQNNGFEGARMLTPLRRQVWLRWAWNRTTGLWRAPERGVLRLWRRPVRCMCHPRWLTSTDRQNYRHTFLRVVMHAFHRARQSLTKTAHVFSSQPSLYQSLARNGLPRLLEMLLCLVWHWNRNSDACSTRRTTTYGTYFAHKLCTEALAINSELWLIIVSTKLPPSVAQNRWRVNILLIISAPTFLALVLFVAVVGSSHGAWCSGGVCVVIVEMLH